MFARFDENPAMTLRVIKETKRYGRTDARMHARTDGQRENSIPPTNKVCGGYNKLFSLAQYIQSQTAINIDQGTVSTVRIWCAMLPLTEGYSRQVKG